MAIIISCGSNEPKKASNQTLKEESDFQYETEQFADLKILRYRVSGFDSLTLKQKELLYYLTQAAYFGREIIYDQNFKHNLCIKRTLDAIVQNYKGNKETEDYKKFMVYTKRVWFSNGIHHHYSSDKFLPEFSKEYFAELVKNSPDAKFPLQDGETVDQLVTKLTPVMFDPKIAAKKVVLDPTKDMIATSATNYYEGLTQKEVESFYAKLVKKGEPQPVETGLNSKLIKENGTIVEKTWKVGGMYTAALEKIVFWLEKAIPVAENDNQKKSLEKLVEFFKTGDLKTWDAYNILWVQDVEAVVDVTNGFIEVYEDPLGYKGAFESVVSIKDFETTKQFSKLSSEAAWFEKNSPIMDEHKRENPKGVTYKVIQVVAESGDASPSTPIGINLPNANWIRAIHGSKSVSLGNIEDAYAESAKTGGLLQEFHTLEQVELIKKYGTVADKLHTGLHEVIGHGSGKLNVGVGNPNETLKNYANTLEEARADLVGLYYLYDKHLVELGLIPSTDAGKASYDEYISNGLMVQLRRLKLGDNVEEAHMRNRQLIAKWCFEKGKKDNVIEQKKIEGKTYFVVNDYDKLHTLFGQLLREMQRIKSEGDYNAGKNLVETYAVKVDQELHKEVIERFTKLNSAAYSGFINPKLIPVMQGDKIVDVKIEYPKDFMEQMLWFAKEYAVLPTYN